MMQMTHYMILSIIMLFLVIILMMISVAFLTLFERKMMGLFHYRKGPNKTGLTGILQPFSDAMKLLSKEFFLPYKANLYLYLTSPMMMFILISLMWLIYPFMTNLINFNFNSLFFLSIMSMGVYSMMIMGWSSNSTFSMIGAIRSIAQSISFEVTFAISLLIMMNMINSLNLINFFYYSKYLMLMFMFYPMIIILMISMLAELNRTPFDLSEGESELVSGFNIEYGSSKFTLIFLSEYSSLLLMMMMLNMIFFNINMLNLKFYLNLILMIFFITWIRMTFPRIRYDKLMYLCWFFLLPFCLINYMMLLTFFKMPLDLIMIMN
nr:NADH dehydrogenase subunit 1 [Meteorus sp. 2 XHS-2023a]